MPKRSNPYIEDFIQQRKTHVGIKQFNNNEERMEKIYEKTLELLFNGAKTTLINKPLNEVSYKNNDKMKQLFINNNGALKHGEALVVEKKFTLYCNCNKTMESVCTYCDTRLCDSCQHYCHICNKYYCSKCLLVGTEHEEVCISCYS